MSFILTMTILLGAFVMNAQKLQTGHVFTNKACYANLRNDTLTMGNAHIRRSWRIEHGQLFATSFFDVDRKVEWISRASKLPSPTAPGVTEEGEVEMRGAGGVFGPTEAESLRVELQVAGVHSSVTYAFQIFPDAAGVRMSVSQQGERGKASGSSIELSDAIEHLQTDKQHLKFTQVTLRDRTDARNELVFEDEWLLQPNEALLQLQGNLFFLEDTLTGAGLVFLKEAPLPEMRVVKTTFDATMRGAETSLSKTHDKGRTLFEISFYGHGLEGNGYGYASTLIAYDGGRSGRIAALHRYQRQIRMYRPGRDGQLVSNTWGDRSAGTKLNEEFIRGEIDAGKGLGVDIVEVDDGWEVGKTIANKGEEGVWEGFRAHQADFWKISPVKFPNGFLPLADYSKAQGMRLGVWYAPDSANDFQGWREDADQLLTWNRKDHVAAFKLDSIKLRSKMGESNYHALLDRVLNQSSGNILLDLDATAETRQGYFGNIAAGPVFVENRYTDWHRYWPHQTLRNFWKLAQYVDPVRLRMEFLNSERNTSFYQNDPLAPANYRSSYLFATTMFASPLAWFETTSLSPRFVADAKPVIAAWKKERDSIYEGTTIPIGEAPDGITWTGFESVAQNGRSGYLLVFRELNRNAIWVAPRELFSEGMYHAKVLGGEGSVTQTRDGFEVNIPRPLGFVWVKLETSNN